MSKFTLKKIPIEPLLDILANLMAEGADYVDIEGFVDPNEDKDIIKIFAPPEYYSMEEDDDNDVEEEEFDEDDIRYNKLSEDELDKLAEE